MKIQKAVIFLLIVFFLPQGVSSAQPDAKTGVLSVENGRYRVWQDGEGEPWYDPMKGGRVKFTFQVKDKVEGNQGTIILDNLTSRLKELNLFSHRLMITGEEATAGASVITIIDLQTGSVLDTLMGFGPSFSPGGRFLVFQKYYSPKSSDPQKQSDLVLLYDLERSMEENRMKGLSTYRNNPIGLITEAGRPVFPAVNARKKRYRVWVRDEGKRHRIIPGGFFWLKNDNRLAFVDRMGESFQFIVVDHGFLESEPRIHSGEFDPLEDNTSGELMAGEEPPSLMADRFHLEEVLVLESGKVQIHLSDQKGEDQFWQFPPEAFEPALNE